MSDTLTVLTAQAMGYAWGQQDAGIGRHVSAHTFAHHFRALRSQPNCPSVQDAWATFIDTNGERVRFTMSLTAFLDGLVAGGSTNIEDDR